MSKEPRVNEGIRAREVRVIDDKGQQLGVMTVNEALRLAGERELDLVEVAPGARPIVCRIMDFGKHKYEQSKRDRQARKKQKVINVKEIRMSPKIDDHDLNVKLKAAEKFLRAGDRVKVTVRFRGREIVHADLARTKLLELAKSVSDTGAIEGRPKMEGRHMIMFLMPKTELAKSEKTAAASSTNSE